MMLPVIRSIIVSSKISSSYLRRKSFIVAEDVNNLFRNSVEKSLAAIEENGLTADY